MVMLFECGPAHLYSIVGTNSRWSLEGWEAATVWGPETTGLKNYTKSPHLISRMPPLYSLSWVDMLAYLMVEPLFLASAPPHPPSVKPGCALAT